ncbi:MAG: NAD(P)H-hydrate dehydratase [Gammaproteobacteria bacterium]|nr:MAG: NAD(P)H-hydrate dehydratase [Gammaproteobacteria bacterium]
MSAWTKNLYSAAQVREIDRIAIEDEGIPAYSLMCRAGAAAYSALRAYWLRVHRLVVVCGPGNNGGDGYVLARLAMQDGLAVKLVQVGEESRLNGAARQAADEFHAVGGQTLCWNESLLRDADVVVDGLFGTGLDRPLNHPILEVAKAMNKSTIPVLALDIPSGLHADTGQVLGAAVNAELTVTFIARKLGLYTGEGPELSGSIMLASLEVPERVTARLEPMARVLDPIMIEQALPPRPRTVHKGDHGRVLIVGGNHGMPGAACLTAIAAARTGAGIVEVVTRPAHVAVIVSAQPELLVRGVMAAGEAAQAIKAADIVAIGPGLGTDRWASALLGRVLDTDKPAVWDADALNLLARDPVRRDDWILTPHPGEAARLLGVTPREIQNDRYGAVIKLHQRYGGVVVLKGAGTLVTDGQGPTAVCSAGNPGMASGGMGDVLTGVIAALVAQGLSLGQAARMGVLIHAHAADQAARDGERGLLATDLLPFVRALVNPKHDG